MKIEEVKQLLSRWEEATVTDAEERELRVYFLQNRDIPDEWRYAQTMFCGMEALGAERMPVKIRLHRRHHIVRWSAAAAAAIVCAVVCYTQFIHTPYCYIDGKPIYDKFIAMQTTSYLDGFATLDQQAQMFDDLMQETN